MIVRVQGDRQYRLDAAAQRELDEIDGRLIEATRRKDAEETHRLLKLFAGELGVHINVLTDQYLLEGIQAAAKKSENPKALLAYATKAHPPTHRKKLS